MSLTAIVNAVVPWTRRAGVLLVLAIVMVAGWYYWERGAKPTRTIVADQPGDVLPDGDDVAGAADPSGLTYSIDGVAFEFVEVPAGQLIVHTWVTSAATVGRAVVALGVAAVVLAGVIGVVYWRATSQSPSPEAVVAGIGIVAVVWGGTLLSQDRTAHHQLLPAAQEHLKYVWERPFFMSKTEITRSQYAAIMDEITDERPWGPDVPIAAVSWDDATEFCRRLSEELGVTVRLPTEAEWVYASRGTTQAEAFPGVTDRATLESIGWFIHNSDQLLQPVGRLPANRWGLHDIYGNVFEWCSESFEDDLFGPDHLARRRQMRMLLGGSAEMSAKYFSTNARGFVTKSHGPRDVGFRVMIPARAPDAAPHRREDDE